MAINPGVLGQKAKPGIVVEKLYRLNKLCSLQKLFVQCDGGVTFETIPELRRAGVNNFVCGSSTLYKECDFRKVDNVLPIIEKNKNKLDDALNHGL